MAGRSARDEARAGQHVAAAGVAPFHDGGMALNGAAAARHAGVNELFFAMMCSFVPVPPCYCAKMANRID